jgi:DNA uptake protein ComE-like DNA-binding protein
MTEEIANAIMDWIDSDEERRIGGAESADYQGLAIPYSARNGPIESIDELLQIQGITPALFYGEDANRNGMLDPNEDDGNESLPNDNADGILDAGWREYFTASSKERNATTTGDKKININGTILTELFDEIEEAFDTETATFIIAYRLWGNENADPATVKSLTVDQKELAQAIYGQPYQPGRRISITRNGMNLNQVSAYSFRSIYDVIDAQVEAEINNAPQTLTSPWTSGNLLEKMPEFEGFFHAHVDDAVLDGRININIARREVLLAIPDMTESMADMIVSMRPPVEDSGLASRYDGRPHFTDLVAGRKCRGS